MVTTIRKQFGFTIIQLMVALAIASAAAVTTIPKMQAAAQERIAERAGEEMTQWLIAARHFRQDFGAWPADIQALVDNGYMPAAAMNSPFSSAYSVAVNGNNMELSVDTGSAAFAKLLSGTGLPVPQVAGNVVSSQVGPPGEEIALDAYLPRSGIRPMTGSLNMDGNNIDNAGTITYGAGQNVLNTADNATSLIRSTDAGSTRLELATSDGVGRGRFAANSNNDVGLQNSDGNWAFRSRTGGNTVISASGTNRLTLNGNGAVVNGDVEANHIFSKDWFHSVNANEGMMNDATGTEWFSPANGQWVMAGGGSNNSIQFRDSRNGANRGGVYASSSQDVGFIDAGGTWGIRHRNDMGSYFTDNNNTLRFSVGPNTLTGSYGTVETSGSGKGGWSGYNINGDVALMYNEGSGRFGLYDDLNNKWAFQAYQNAESVLYYNGGAKLATNNSGVDVIGNLDASGSLIFGPNNFRFEQINTTYASLRSAAGNQAGLQFRNSSNNLLGSVRGEGSSFGLRDSNDQWMMEHSLGNYTQFSDGGIPSFIIGADGITGDYGTVQTVGNGRGGFSGYGIDGEAGLFRDDGTGLFGLFDDANDNWGLSVTPNGTTSLYYSGGIKLSTTNTGVSITGSLNSSQEVNAYNGNIGLKNNGIYFESNRHAITWNDGKGNFNIRVGNGPNESITEDGYAFHTEYAQGSGQLQWNISQNGSTGDAISWDTSLVLSPGTLTLNGDQVLTRSLSDAAYVNVTGDTMSGTLASTVGVGSNIFTFPGTGSGSYLRRITNQGGLALNADSSIVVYAGDNHGTFQTDFGIPTNTSNEDVIIAADKSIRLISNYQNGFGGSHEALFGNDGTFYVSSLTAPKINGSTTVTGAGPVNLTVNSTNNRAALVLNNNDITNGAIYASGTGIRTGYGANWASNTAIHVNNNNGFVGIKNNAPSYEFDVAGNIYASKDLIAGTKVRTDLIEGKNYNTNMLDFAYSEIAPNAVALSTNNSVAINFDTNNNNAGGLAFTVGHNGQVGDADYEELLRVAGNNTFTYKGFNVYHAGVDGAGSGMDADFFDSLDSTQFLRSDINDTMNAKLSIAASGTIAGNTFNNGWLKLGTSSDGIAFDPNEIYGATNISIKAANGDIDLNTTGIAAVNGSKIFTDSYRPYSDRWTTARKMTLGGDLTGNVTFNGSSDFVINGQVANDSHWHDGRYFTETESDSRYQRTNYVDTSSQFLFRHRNSENSAAYFNQTGSGDIARFYKGGAAGDTTGIGVTITNDGSIKTDSDVIITRDLLLSTNGDTYKIGADSFEGAAGVMIRPADNVNPADGGKILTVRSGGGSPRLFVEHNGRTGTSNADFFVGVASDSTGGNRVFHDGYHPYADDASTLDGLTASQFLRSDVDDFMGGRLTIDSGTTIAGGNLDNGAIIITNGGLKLAIDSNEIYAAQDLNIGTTGGNVNFTTPGGNVRINGGTAWHSSNDGAGSGLDADRLDNLTSGQFLRADAVDVSSSQITFNGGIKIGTNQRVIHNTIQSRDKYRVWASEQYAIGMDSGYTFGHLNNDYAMTFQMNNDADRGFWWGDENDSNAQGAMSLTTDGRLHVGNKITVGSTANVVFHDAYHPNADRWTTARNIALGGDLSGNASIDGTSDITIVAQVADDSHLHDGRYYTEAESEARYINVGETASDSDKLDNIDSTGFQRLNFIDTSNQYLYRHRSNSNAVAYFNQTGTGDIARFFKGTSSSDTTGSSSVRITNNGGIVATGGINSAGNISSGSEITATGKIRSAAEIEAFNGSIALRSNGLYLESSQHAITWNDGGGNFNIRVGNSPSGQITEDGYAFHTVWNQSNGSLAWKVSQNGLAGDTAAWGTTLVLDDDGTLKLDNNRVYTTMFRPESDKWTTARTMTLGGDLSGNVTFDGSSDFLISGQVANDSHLHDGRYYTESESNTKFAYKTLGTKNGETNRTVYDTGIYSYNVVNSSTGKAPGTTYGSVLTWGRGGAGSAQLSIGWTAGDQNEIYFRSLRDTTDNWWSWKKIFHTGNDGPGSTLSADFLDDLNSTQFLRSDTDDTLNGRLTISSSGTIGNANFNNGWLKIGSSSAGISFDPNEIFASTDLIINASGGHLQLKTSGIASVNGSQIFTTSYRPYADRWTNSRTLSLSGDLTGSVSFNGANNFTLNATVLNDSHTHDSRYYTEAESNSRFVEEILTADDITTRVGSGFFETSSPTIAEGYPEDSSWYHLLSTTHNNASNYHSMQFAGDFYNSNDLFYRITANNGNAAWSRIWHSSNDGQSSGMDSDLFDGFDSTAFTRADLYTSGDFDNAEFLTSSRLTSGNISTNTPFGNQWYSVANIRHRGGVGDGNQWGTQLVFGMTANLNRMSFRGQSSGTWNSWNHVWNSGYQGSGTGMDSDLLDGLNSTQFLRSDTNDTMNGKLTIAASGSIGNANFNNGWIKIGTPSDGLAIDPNQIYSATDLNIKANGGNINFATSGIAAINGQQIFTTAYRPYADKWTTARTVTLAGDLTGSVSFDGSNNFTLSAQVANDSHTHDTRYYTESESDARFINVGEKASDSDKLDGLDSSNFQRLSYIDGSNNYLFRHRNSSGSVLFVNQTGTGDIARFYRGSSSTDTSGAAQIVFANDASIFTTGSLDAAVEVRFGASNLKFYQQSAAYGVFQSNNSNTTGLRLEDNTGALRVALVGSGDNSGLLDGDGQYSILHVRDSKTEFRINNAKAFSIGADGVTGSYGTVETAGTGKGGWSGYSINGQTVFMDDGTSAGIYSDANDEWMLRSYAGGATELYYGGLSKLQTYDNGVHITGSVNARYFIDSDDENYFVNPAGSSVQNELVAKRYLDLDDISFVVDPAGNSIVNYLGAKRLYVEREVSIGGSCTQKGQIAQTYSGELASCTVNSYGNQRWKIPGAPEANAPKVIGSAEYNAVDDYLRFSTGAIWYVEKLGTGVFKFNLNEHYSSGYAITCSFTAGSGAAQERPLGCKVGNVESNSFEVSSVYDTGGSYAGGFNPLRLFVTLTR